MCDDHPWRLTAPWWRWPRRGEAGPDPRRTAPVLQMYDTSDPVTAFVRNPQDSLAFGSDDRVQMLTAVAAVKDDHPPARYLRSPGSTRKVFLPTHKRFYLVVCELHCDRPGLPNVRRDKVCQMGMVVRRRRLQVPASQAAAAASLVERSGRIQAQIAQLQRRAARRVLAKRHRVGGGIVAAVAGSALKAAAPVADVVQGEKVKKLAVLEAELKEVRQALRDWKGTAGVVTVSEGWIDSDAEGVGAWQVVPETPVDVVEKVYPLQALVPDPRDPDHHAAGKTVFFGLLPAGGREAEPSGDPRWDEETLYQVRCFVRRHHCGCPRTREGDCCGGELVWSEPTEVYRLAGHFDPVGTANQTVAIQLPDFRELAATTDVRLPVSMHAPAGSTLLFTEDDGKAKKQGKGVSDFPQICYFSIPLITIVATFVLKLFLPIVVFVFGLWWMLSLRFCIPPSLKFSGGVHADLKLSGKLDLAIQAELSAGIGGNLALAGVFGAAQVDLDVRGETNFNASFFEDPPGPLVHPDPGTPGAQVVAELGGEESARLGLSVSAGREQPPVPTLQKQVVVSREEVFA